MSGALRGVYLRPLPDPRLPARHSAGARRRAAQLQGFLRELHGVAVRELAPHGEVELLVVSKADWKQLYSYPYGLPFTRSRPGGVHVVVAADYPPRMLRRFDDLLLAAARAGAPAPGDLREFLDLLAGHEWGHAVANLAGLRTRVRWLDEWLATYLFLLALQGAGFDGVLERFLAWAEVQVRGAGVERADLGAFEYPRHKLRLSNLLWFQGVLTRRAAELLPRGWELPRSLRAALPAPRGDVARALIEVEPSFRAWFTVFAASEGEAEPGEA